MVATELQEVCNHFNKCLKVCSYFLFFKAYF